MSAEIQSFSKHSPKMTNDFNFELRTSLEGISYPHYHDCYELSLLAKGNFITAFTGKNLLVQSGSLLFTRPNDIHLKKVVAPQIKFLNIAFSEKVLRSLCDYLGKGFDIDDLKSSKEPPIAHLESAQVTDYDTRFEEILHTKDAETQTTKLRILLFYGLTTYFMDAPRPEAATENLWLVHAMKEMEQIGNFVEGMPALLRITGKTHEHICRTMKKMFGYSPSQFINSLRLSHAENLLLHTDMDILTVSMESGFNSLSNFYTDFKKRFGCSPLQYRKKWSYFICRNPIGKISDHQKQSHKNEISDT